MTIYFTYNFDYTFLITSDIIILVFPAVGLIYLSIYWQYNNMGGSNSLPTHSPSQHRAVKSNRVPADRRYQLFHDQLFATPDLKNLETYFGQTPGLAQGLLSLFNRVNNSYDSFVEVMTFLTQLDVDAEINPWLNNVGNQTSILDRFLMLTRGVESVNAYKKMVVNREEKEECVMKYFSLFCKPRKEHLEKVFQMIEGFNVEEPLSQFSQKLRHRLEYCQKLLIDYWTDKFSHLSRRHSIYSQPPNSNLLSIEDWVILGMKNMKILKNTPQLLYSLEQNGSSFTTLYRNLIGYKGPWMLTLSHYESDSITKEVKLCILGSFNTTPVEDLFVYQGNPESFLFRLSPDLRYFTASTGDGESNFFLINTTESSISKNPRGLGFGGKDKEECKLWIDEHIQSKSYVTSKEDPTYGYGIIGFPGTSTLRVRDLEIWGLGNEESLKEREEYWASREEESMKRRKVNKKQLLSGGACSLILENTFKHREQIVGELPSRKEDE